MSEGNSKENGTGRQGKEPYLHLVPDSEQQEMLIAHAAVCRWFSGLLAQELDRNAIDALYSPAVDGLLGWLENDLELEGVGRLRETIAALDNIPDAELELRADFAGLFLADARHAAPPLLSPYLDESGLFGQQPAEDMRQLLSSANTKALDAFKNAEDHFSIVLDYLSNRLLAASNGSFDATSLNDFLAQAFQPALSIFAQRCNAFDKAPLASDLYPQIASLLAQYMLVLGEQLRDLHGQ